MGTRSFLKDKNIEENFFQMSKNIVFIFGNKGAGNISEVNYA